MRFVGEMLRATIDGATRADVYAEAQRYGLNVDKSRWIASLLQDAGLIVPPRHGSLLTTPTGSALLSELPLAEPDEGPDPQTESVPVAVTTSTPLRVGQAEILNRLARAPMALDQGSGKAFEHAIRDAFASMGFDARTISGPGDTDVLVKWSDGTGSEHVAIIEAKARASGGVSHTDVSDVALETHKSRHGANHIAVIAPAFVGHTIENMAAARSWTLIEASTLGAIVDEVVQLGISPAVSGVLFQHSGGLDAVDAAIRGRRRELAVLSFVVGQLAEEAAEAADPITPRDISRDGRRIDLQPSVEEVLTALTTLQDASPGAIRMIHENDDPKFSSFAMGNPRSAASALRAIADAIEAPLPAAW
jgi:hypothetical protein